jgi:hypothetical protein
MPRGIDPQATIQSNSTWKRLEYDIVAGVFPTITSGTWETHTGCTGGVIALLIDAYRITTLVLFPFAKPFKIIAHVRIPVVPSI